MSSFGISKEQLQSGSPEEIAVLAANCLALLEPGVQPLPLFEQIARLTVLSTVEVVPFRETLGELEVLLAKRSADDLWWPNKLHIPGTVLMPTDEERYLGDYETPIERIIKNEFNNTVARVDTIHVFDAHRRSGARGSEQTVFCWTKVDLNNGHIEPSGGEFFDVTALLSRRDLIVGHAETVDSAIANMQQASNYPTTGQNH